MVSATAHVNDPLDNTYGATYIGTLLSAIIYGVTLLQTFSYFQRYPRDPWFIKSTVAVVIVFDTMHMFAVASLDYHYLITNYNKPIQLTYLTWHLMFEIMLLILGVTIVHLFFIYRVFKLSNNKPLTVCLFLLAMLQMVIGLYWISLAWPKKTYFDLLALLYWIVINNVLVCLTDISITASLCIFLYRSRTGTRRTDTLVTKLIVFVVSTGVLPTIFVTLALIISLTRPLTLIFSALYYVSIHLYTNAFMTSLNIRSVFHTDVIELTQTNMSFTPGDKSRTAAGDSRNIDILIGTTSDEINRGTEKKRPIAENGDDSV